MSPRSSSSSALVVSCVLGTAVASAYMASVIAKRHPELWNDCSDRLSTAIGASTRGVAVLLKSQSLVQGRVIENDGDTEITSSLEMESSVSSSSDDSSTHNRVVVEPKDIPRNIQATEVADSAELVMHKPHPSSESHALLATSIVALLLLVWSFVNE